MYTEYEIPMVLRIRATDDVKAVRVAEYFMAAARRFNGADLSLQDGGRPASPAGALQAGEPQSG